ncbi:hypothetical protein VA7868_03867 [Vibrio aerogenes CECT 7868]|uniref:CARDB domain-containing protein n=1 Tax=Vibrio aerogenes CECT 7868 TaxID=1216006 RepID=A0A1M6BU26_9VIBR|nr:hypothetical protein [Vibrio aerogenes]SHI52191.1 hypothetical protein VA7868_03867 [Vibrio aerogenes CECT 7868]
MKKLIAPLLLLPSLAFGYTNTVTIPSDAKCYSTSSNVGMNIKVLNLSSRATTFKFGMITQTGSEASSINYKFRLNNGGHEYASFTPETEITVPANSAKYMYMKFNFESSDNKNENNSCDDLPEMIRVTHMDANSQIVVSGYSMSSNLKFDLKFNEGKPF